MIPYLSKEKERMDSTEHVYVYNMEGGRGK
jgi:hypothetical protein